MFNGCCVNVMWNNFVHSAVILDILCFVSCTEFRLRHVVPIRDVYSTVDSIYKTKPPQPVFKNNDAKESLRDDDADLVDHQTSSPSPETLTSAPQLKLSAQLANWPNILDKTTPEKLLGRQDDLTSSTWYPVDRNALNTTTTAKDSLPNTTTTALPDPPIIQEDIAKKCASWAKCQLKVWPKLP